MRNRCLTIWFMAAVLVMAVANFASADTIHGINMDFVTIGNAGNLGDTQSYEESIRLWCGKL